MILSNSSGFCNFLLTTKNKTVKTNKFCIVIGNEASDLDSMVSSIVFAYYKSLEDTNTVYIPVMHIKRADFKLRTEAVYLFNLCKINLLLLTFLDEIELNSILDNQNNKLILIDHNKLALTLENYSDNITEIIDHHKDENLYEHVNNKTIEPVGSAATLVADKFINKQVQILDKNLSTLLLGTILLDTVNLDPKAERVTKKDDYTANKLLEISFSSQIELFNKIQHEKFNVSALCTYDLLRKDYKEWNIQKVKFGIGSVLLSIDEWFKKDNNLLNEFAEFSNARNLDILYAMNAYTNPDFHRDLVVFCADKDFLKSNITFLIENADMKLTEIIPIDQTDTELGFIAFYKQGNLGISRKKLQPLLNDYFNRI